MLFPMALHSHAGDIVSRTVASSGYWDTGKTAQLLASLRGDPGQAPGTLVDVGANVGWFTMEAAMAGFSVVAVEPFEENHWVLKHSLCLAQPAVRDRVTLLQVGLHDRDGVLCQLWQQPSQNRGDTLCFCDPKNASGGSFAKMEADGYRKLGEASMRRFDSLVAEGTVQLSGRVVMKIDVEGFEAFALRGAEAFLNGTSRPERIFSEFSPFLMELASQTVGEDEGTAAAKAQDFLEFMRSVGYVATPVVEGMKIQDIEFTSVTEPV